MSDTQIVATLTSTETQTAQTLADSISVNVTSVVSPNTFVYWVGFDGTRNNEKDPALSGDTQSTAIGAIRDQILKAKAANVEVGYYPGPGTPDTGGLLAAINPMQQAEIAATNAYNDFADKARAWRQGNPGGTITTMMATFSRGSVAGAEKPGVKKSLGSGLQEKPGVRSRKDARKITALCINDHRIKPHI